MTKGKTVVHINIGERQIEDIQGIDVIVTTKDNTKILYDKWYATEQEEPCGDCISRQEAVHAFDYCLGMNKVQAQDILMRLPSVTLTGHWIEKDGFDGDVYYDCSECGESWTTIEGTPWDNGMNYCPNCGARMESGDNE